jgi:ADP-ribose pyrophosphatase YjhB (NUDIX family)
LIKYLKVQILKLQKLKSRRKKNRIVGLRDGSIKELKKEKIQCVALGVVVKNNFILTYSVEDKVSKDIFYRLIGGHIDFGEPSEVALIREFKEEIDAEINIVKQLDVFENIYFYNGNNCHEFVSLFLVEFLDDEIYELESIVGHEGPSRTYKASWVPIEDFKNNKKILYPPEILNHI